ncbi:acyl-CoA thioesterase [Xanthobacter dioxanivorans]|uniref:Acyl-CoA thioesterase n=1 Tax=Xanthobacter dioxanivorans TaxID=2528964 RepID=A0A974PJ45_9HYPH|nr:thioesterase family protein [Xanthobacter dioxanivorans]QRG04513.1 acyl-CoA thioesterase [Xanthobacter dioxanivorans]
MSARARPPLPRLEDFPVKAVDTIRYGDTDKLGHVNNAVFSTFLETGRTRVLLDAGRPIAPAGAGFVIARLVLDYIAEMHWPGQVEIGTGVTAIGRSSVTMRQALFQNGACTATAETVIVLFDMAHRRPLPLPEASRALLGELLPRTGS